MLCGHAVQIKFATLLQTYTSYSKLPSYMSTMGPAVLGATVIFTENIPALQPSL